MTLYEPFNRFSARVILTRCRESVYERSSFSSHQCVRKAVVFRCVDGDEVGFCKQHDPEAVKAREKARVEQLAREHAEARAKHQRRTDAARACAAARNALEQIAAGHNDPRALAAEVLALFPDDTTPPRSLARTQEIV